MNTQAATALMAEPFPLPTSTNLATKTGHDAVAETDTASSAVAEVTPAKPTPVKKAAKATKETKTPKAAKAPAQAPVAPSADTKEKRAKKPKVVRDSFTMPKQDYDKIQALKQKCLEAGVAVKKSELLRAGLIMLEAAATTRLLAAVKAVETVKTGRPAKS
ncbi:MULTISPECIES: hypothetical protein [unclassified Burkholderia]|uniref:hypothetical protein n=1 Tax=unclassified Burkholderia TaxID=2613784 RepID=UPI002AB1F328|nr:MULTISPECIES: hypothetical protein [unclassified Burkholderia]